MLSGNTVRRDDGFSIIEIAITLAILSMLLGLTVPSVASRIGNARIRSSAESLLGGLQHARNEAVRRNRNVSF